MKEQKTFYKHKGVVSHQIGEIAKAAKKAARNDHDELYGRAGTFEFLRFENFKQKNWREGIFGEIRNHRCWVTVIWKHNK